LVVALLVFAQPASADWHLTPFLGWTLDGNTTFPDPENTLADRSFGRGHLVFGASVTRFWRGPLGVEGLLAYVPGLFDREEFIAITSSRSVAAMGNLVVTIPRAWSEHGLRPFASGGFGLMHVAQTYPGAALSFRRNVLGYNVGGGAVGPLTDRTGLRFEVRRFSYVKSGEISGVSIDRENLSYWTATAGVVIRY
jgi:hypothetical protein